MACEREVVPCHSNLLNAAKSLLWVGKEGIRLLAFISGYVSVDNQNNSRNRPLFGKGLEIVFDMMWYYINKDD